MRKLLRDEIVEIELLLDKNKKVDFISKELNIPLKLIKKYLKYQKVHKHSYFSYLKNALQIGQISKNEMGRTLEQFYKNKSSGNFF